MIQIENVDICGLNPAIRGMRNPMNSWDKSDSVDCIENTDCNGCMWSKTCSKCASDDITIVGSADLELMKTLASGGPCHAKYRRMITVYLDITGPLYWWKEFDTYKIGTVSNSCSTMHKIHAKEFTLDDFSHEHLLNFDDESNIFGTGTLASVIIVLNQARAAYLDTGDKRYWWQMIQLLPSSYNQRRTIMLNYEVLARIFHDRKQHKLDEWRDFCKWIKALPLSELITGEMKQDV